MESWTPESARAQGAWYSGACQELRGRCGPWRRRRGSGWGTCACASVLGRRRCPRSFSDTRASRVPGASGTTRNPTLSSLAERVAGDRSPTRRADERRPEWYAAPPRPPPSGRACASGRATMLRGGAGSRTIGPPARGGAHHEQVFEPATCSAPYPPPAAGVLRLPTTVAFRGGHGAELIHLSRRAAALLVARAGDLRVRIGPRKTEVL